MRFSSSLTRNKTTHLCNLLTRNGNKWTSKHEQRRPAPSRRLMEVRAVRKSRGGWAGLVVPWPLLSLGPCCWETVTGLDDRPQGGALGIQSSCISSRSLQSKWPPKCCDSEPSPDSSWSLGITVARTVLMALRSGSRGAAVGMSARLEAPLGKGSFLPMCVLVGGVQFLVS